LPRLGRIRQAFQEGESGRAMTQAHAHQHIAIVTTLGLIRLRRCVSSSVGGFAVGAYARNVHWLGATWGGFVWVSLGGWRGHGSGWPQNSDRRAAARRRVVEDDSPGHYDRQGYVAGLSPRGTAPRGAASPA